MKNLVQNFLLTTVTLGTLLCGCASGGPFLTPQTAQAQVVGTNVVSETNLVTVTNRVVESVAGVTVTNTVTQTNVMVQTVPVLVTNTVTVTNGYAVSGTVSNILAGAGVVNGVTAPLDPYSGLITLGLGGVAAAFGWFARLKTKQAQEHLSTSATIITAVENLAPAVGDGVKAAIAQQALKMGTSSTVAATVTAVTNGLAATS